MLSFDGDTGVEFSSLDDTSLVYFNDCTPLVPGIGEPTGLEDVPVLADSTLTPPSPRPLYIDDGLNLDLIDF